MQCFDPLTMKFFWWWKFHAQTLLLIFSMGCAFDLQWFGFLPAALNMFLTWKLDRWVKIIFCFWSFAKHNAMFWWLWITTTIVKFLKMVARSCACVHVTFDDADFGSCPTDKLNLIFDAESMSAYVIFVVDAVDKTWAIFGFTKQQQFQFFFHFCVCCSPHSCNLKIINSSDCWF